MTRLERLALWATILGFALMLAQSFWATAQRTQQRDDQIESLREDVRELQEWTGTPDAHPRHVSIRQPVKEE